MSDVECLLPSRAETRRQHIKEVARRLFVEHGFHATGIALIARVSGVAVQQLYRDFPAKEDIIAAIVEEGCARFADLATLDAALATENREGVRDWLTAATSGKDDDGDRLFIEIAAEASRNERINSIFAQVRQSMLNNVSRAFAGLMESGTVRQEHCLLAEAFTIISLGSACTRALQGEDVHLASAKLIEGLIDSIR